MSVLLKEIKHRSKEAATVLEKADLRTDSEIQSLTQEDLHELFPGPQKFKLRKTIFQIIHTQKPIDVIVRELKDFIPHESFRAALTSNGVLVDYLHILKEMKTQMNNVQTFLDVHIGLLEEFTTKHQEPDKDFFTRMSPRDCQEGSLADTSTSGSSGPVVPCDGQTEGHPQAAQGTHTSHGGGQMMLYTGQTNPQEAQEEPFTWMSPQDYQEEILSVAKVMYRMIVSGVTFDAHTQLLYKVKAQASDSVQLIESDQDCQIIIVFCTVSSRAGSDVEAAMCDVTGDKPVILVLMHHSRVDKHIKSTRTWANYPNVVLHVNTVFHDTVHGLLECHQNNDAASKIRNKLLEYCIQERKDTSGNARGVGGYGGAIATAAHGGGGDGYGGGIATAARGGDGYGGGIATATGGGGYGGGIATATGGGDGYGGGIATATGGGGGGYGGGIATATGGGIATATGGGGGYGGGIATAPRGGHGGRGGDYRVSESSNGGNYLWNYFKGYK